MPPNYKIEYLQATNDDIDYLVDLRIQTMSEHLRKSSVFQSGPKLRERVLYRFDCARIIVINGERAGLLKVVKEGEEWELSQIQLLGKYQRKGIGEEIIRNIIHEANQKGAHIKLSVLKANPARRLYERLGFVVIRENEHSFDMSNATK
jgi:ribosomal protein S18 acetylase RimI-like enzyme